MASLRTTVSDYTQGTAFEGWGALEGVPAFISLMGLHGVLRPDHHEKPDIHRKAAEFNKPHPRGTPLFFDRVIVHVDLNRDGTVITSPYEIGFKPETEAIRKAMGGKKYWELLLDTFGGNPFEEGLPPSRRVIFTVGLCLGLYGLSRVGEEIIGVVGPATAALGAISFGAVTYLDYKLQILNRLGGIIRGNDKERAVSQDHLPSNDLSTKPQPVPDNMRHAYLGHGSPRVPEVLYAETAVYTALRNLPDNPSNLGDVHLQAGIKNLVR